MQLFLPASAGRNKKYRIFITRNRIILAPSNQRQVQIFLLGKSLISAIALACVSLKYLIRYQSCSLPVSGEAAVNAVSISLLALQNCECSLVRLNQQTSPPKLSLNNGFIYHRNIYRVQSYANRLVKALLGERNKLYPFLFNVLDFQFEFFLNIFLWNYPS